MSLQTTLADEAILTEGQFLLEGQTMNSENSLCSEKEPEDQQFPKGKGRIYSQSEVA
jgi:hypothetical protein